MAPEAQKRVGVEGFERVCVFVGGLAAVCSKEQERRRVE